MSTKTETQKHNEQFDRLARLKAKQERSKRVAEHGYPDRWEYAEPGDSILGEIVEIGSPIQLDPKYSPVRPVQVARLDREDGIEEVVTVWISPTVLRSKWDELDPMEGDFISITFLGEKKPRNGGDPYHNFDVHLERSRENEAKRKQLAAESFRRRRLAGPDGDNFEPDDELPF